MRSVMTCLAIAISIAGIAGSASASAKSDAITLHLGRDGMGRAVTIAGDVPDLTRRDFYQVARSVTIPSGSGRWEFCTRPDYRGKCITLDRSVDRLRSVGLDRAIASVRKPQ